MHHCDEIITYPDWERKFPNEIVHDTDSLPPPKKPELLWLLILAVMAAGFWYAVVHYGLQVGR